MRARALLMAFLLGPVPFAALGAQNTDPLEARLDRQTVATVRAIIDSARRDSVPSRPLEDKALEGVAKRVAPERVAAAVRQLSMELRDARAILRSGTSRAPLADDEIVAAADALRRGVPAADVTALGHDVTPAIPLVVALTVLGDLAQRGINPGQAREVIEQLIAAGIPPQQVAEIPARMDVGLRVGAPPMDALHSALPVPLGLPKRPPTPRKPDPNLLDRR